MDKKKKTFIIIVLGISIASLLGLTYAYFSARANNSGSNITGRTYDFGASITSSTIYRATNMVPLKDNLVSTAIGKATDKCIDKNNRDVCSLYSITLSNTGDNVYLTPYITTTSSTYTTTDLKCQLYDSNYVAVSDILTPSNTAGNSVYFTNNSNDLSIYLTSNSQTYYLVIWLADTLSSQANDYSKAFSGTITFASGESGQVYVDFTA